ncbi:NACHT domain-containing protein [Schaalia cardiffensis]|uniref:NACHT domain-containing protein n=1 Tax=Schaalia cardiffensis TaxID=181487 RepID=UPI0023F3328C|nr:NACHT domain-containing protein [Schaalia cardiffensis]
MLSLATVTVSALAQPLGPVGVLAAQQLVKLCEKAWSRTSPERQLRETVSTSIQAWAENAHFAPDVIDRGLAWAIEWVQQAGCRDELITELDFDSARAAESVLEQVKFQDKYWGTEDEYLVAERAICAIYAVLCAALKNDGGLILAAIQASRHEARANINQLREELLGVADRHELVAYLEEHVRLWDHSPWTSGRHPSCLERSLEIKEEETRMSPAQALDGVWLLAVLAGPGSGKTWLALRFAREAAEAALKRLRDPRIDPTLVEIPVFTTLAETVKKEGVGFERLVEAALPGETRERIRRFVLHKGSKILAVADSLDEGVSTSAAQTLLHQLTEESGRRIVLTSRPEAWNSACTSLQNKQRTRIVTLTELRYPEDVHGYVKAWFAEEPSTAQHLVGQLEHRQELRVTAANPLLLTFYCMLTEQEPEKELPHRRHELYDRIIDLLLRGGWGTFESQVEKAECRAILREWAWDGVRDAVTPAGLGVWPEKITTTRITQPNIERALDHVAPKQQFPRSNLYDRSQVERRFLHRTLWEYLVAEHIASLPTAKAFEALVPHIWFDKDWKEVVPMAIAAHKKRSKLVNKLWSYHSDHPTSAQKAVNSRLEELVLEVATQTDPEDWNEKNRQRINDLRGQLAHRHLNLVAASAQWKSSNKHAITSLLDSLAKVDSSRVFEYMETLSALGVSAEEHAGAWKEVLFRIGSTESHDLIDLARGLVSLDASAGEREHARKVILDRLPSARSSDVVWLARGVVILDASAEERGRARKVILDRLSFARSGDLAGLAEVLVSLDASAGEREHARKVILDRLPSARSTGYFSARLKEHIDSIAAETLSTMGASIEERGRAWREILDILPSDQFWELIELAEALDKLGASVEERGRARREILDRLPDAKPSDRTDLIMALAKLLPTVGKSLGEWGQSLARLAPAEPSHLIGLAVALDKLGASDEECGQARTAVLASMYYARSWEVTGLVEELSALGASEVERGQALKIILDKLPSARSRDLIGMLGTLDKLGASDVERGQALKIVLDKLPFAESGDLIWLARGLVRLDTSVKERGQFRKMILNRLLPVDSVFIGDLVRALLELEPSDEERGDARKEIVGELRSNSADSFGIRCLVRALLELEPSDEERGDARISLLARLHSVRSVEIACLATTLLELEPNEEERKTLKQAIMSHHLTDGSWDRSDKAADVETLMLVLRKTCPVKEWLSALDCGTDNSECA